MISVLKKLKQKSFKLVGLCALFVGVTATTSTTVWLLNQPKCPEELLK
jgi:cyclic lactone autoinducer peptide